MSQTVHDCGGCLVAGARGFAGVEVGVVAMRGGIGQLVAVGRPDCPEFAVMPCEIIDGSRLETGHCGFGATRTGECCPRYPFVLAILPATVDRAESGSRSRRRCDPRHHDEERDKSPAPSSHLTTSLPTPPDWPPPTEPRRGLPGGAGRG